MLSENFAYPRLMKYFEEFSEIPRASYHEEKIAEYLCDFAKARGLEYYRDKANNVLINKAATSGCEDREAILLQGHTDMVCEKNADSSHDFDKDGLELYEENGWIRARGTTLGADDGVAVAVMLYILDGGVERHGALQCLFTSSEEVGLDGAKSFDYSRIYARRMINMDSADETQIIAGCAGGQRSSLTLESEAQTVNASATLKISIGGLFGGHSGEDIDKGRTNANKLMGRVLHSVFTDGTHLVGIDGGTKDNAIPRECTATVATYDPNAVEQKILALEPLLRQGMCDDDRDFYLRAERVGGGETRVMDTDTARKLIFLLHTVDNGIFDMNHSIPGIVEWSRNLGIVHGDADGAELVFSARSSFESRIDASAAELDSYADILGASVRHYNRYPGWSFAPGSEIREAYVRAFESVCGGKPEITVIHAGLECGFISEAVPDMDIISCGPVVQNLHSPDERLNKASFERFFTVIKKVIEAE